MRWYGLAPFVKGTETVKQMIPELQILVKHFIAQNKDMTKVKCTDLASNMFGSSASFVSSVNSRVLKTIKFYAKPRSLLVFLKLFLAYALKRHKKTTPFLAGGVYYGCKAGVDHARDSLFLKDKEDNKKYIKVKDFREFALTTNKVFISPQAMAAHLFKFKGFGSVQEIEPIRDLKRQIDAWRDANPKKPYITIKDQSAKEAGIGVGTGGGSSAKKKLTKQEFKEPLKKLAKSLEMLHKAIKNEELDEADTRLRQDVDAQFVKIAEIVNYDGRPCYGSEDEDEENDIEEDDEEEDRGSIMDVDDQSNDNTTSGKSGQEESEESSSSSSDNNSASGSSDEETGGDTSKKEKEEEKQGSDGNDADSAADEDMRHKMKSKEMDREGIIDYVKYMKTNGVNISEGKMSGIQIKAALDLAVTPSLTSKHKNYFYVLESESLDMVKEKYKEANPAMVNDDDDDLDLMFAQTLKQLKEAQWHNSIDDLPEGKTLPRENMLLLWKLDQGFTESFFTQPKCKSPQRKTTTPRGKQGTTSGSRVSPRKRSASEGTPPVTNLRKDFDS